MNFHLKIIYFFLLYLWASNQAYSMSLEDENKISPHIQQKDESWKTKLYKKKYPFSEPTFNVHEWALLIFGRKDLQEPLFSLLEEEAGKGNGDAQQKLYLFRKKQIGGINIKNEAKALEILKLGLQMNLAWAHEAKIKDYPQEDLTPSHLFFANHDVKSSQDFLDKKFDYDPLNALRTLETKLLRGHDRNIVCQGFITYWQNKKYFKPLWDAYTNIRILKDHERATLLRAAMNCGYIYAIIESINYYNMRNVNIFLHQDFGIFIERFLPAVKYKSNLISIYSLLETYLHDMSLNLGRIHDQGLFGQPVNKAKALEFYLLAAELGSKEGMNNAGHLFNVGFENRSPDKTRAQELFLKAAGKGVTLAMFNAGILFYYGFDDQSPNESEALNFWHQAALNNFALAMLHLGYHYVKKSNGDNEKKADYLEKAYFWLEKASSLGNREAATFMRETLERSASTSVSASAPEDDNSQLVEAITNVESQVTCSSSENNANETVVQKSVDTKENETSSQEESILLPIETDEKAPVSHSTKNQPKNPKYVREMLRRAGSVIQKRKEEINTTSKTLSSKKAKEAAGKIISSIHSDTLEEHDLKVLFEDPYFCQQVRLKTTKSGICVIAHHLSKKTYAATSAHHNHNTTYNGYHPNFLHELKGILNLFDVTLEMTQ